MSLVEALMDDIFTGLTDAECVAKLDETVEISRDDTAYRWKTLGSKLREKGLDDMELITWNSSIEGLPGCDTFREMLRSDGVDFTDESTRASIAYALSVNTDAVAAKTLNTCLDIGITMGKRYVSYSLSALPSETEVADARILIQNMRDANLLLNECINPLVAQKASLAEIKTAVATWGE